MSLSNSFLANIKYHYILSPLISGAEIVDSNGNSTVDIEDLINSYNSIFVNGKNYYDAIVGQLKTLVGIKDSTIDIGSDSFYKKAQTINSKTIDGNCLEGYRAYYFYLEKIVSLLKKIESAVTQGNTIIAEIKSLNVSDVPANQTAEEYVNGQVQALSAQLYLANKAIVDAEEELESCLKYNADTKSWDNSSYGIETKKIGALSNYADLDKLRELEVSITDANSLDAKHKLTCFSELNLMDRLCYIRRYYELILSNGKTDYLLFPDDKETGYPCIPNKESNTATKATESMGGFELFYVGYLVDRDGSIDAYSSCLEAKSKAITGNITLQSEHIEAFNQYLAFINRAAQLLNQSQGDKSGPIPGAAAMGLSYLCGGTMRDLIEVNGVNYIVIPATNISCDESTWVPTEDKYYEKTEQDSDFKYNASHVYMLVRADEKGMRAFLGDRVDATNNSNGWFNVNDIAQILANDPDYQAYGINVGGEQFGFLVDFPKEDNNPLTELPKVGMDTPSGLDGKFWYVGFENTENNKEILIWDLNNANTDSTDSTDSTARNAPTELEKKYLPKQLTAEEILPQSVAAHYYYRAYDPNTIDDPKQKVGDGWGEDESTGKESAEEANRVINSWTSAFSKKSEFINTSIETINTDITALRTKMDTIDSLCSTLRNRSFETKRQLVSNIRS